MSSIRDMTAEDLILGLMRGERASFKRGYTPYAATASAADMKGIDEDSEEFAELLAFANGASFGYEARRIEAGGDSRTSRIGAAQARGVTLALREDGSQTNTTRLSAEVLEALR